MTKYLTLLVHRIFPIFLFIGLAWGQDEYPYFKDMNKQLKFEQNKIIIEKTEESRQLISGGGHKFNWYSLFSDYEPRYLIEPISTEFEYITTFKITKNNKRIYEIDFLRQVGLNNVADSLTADFIKQVKSFSDITNQIVSDEKGFKDSKTNWLTMGGIFGASTLMLIDKSSTFASLMSGAGAIGCVIYGMSIKQENYKKNREAPFPVVKSFLSNAQVISLAESYNRNLYNDILND